MLVAEKISLNYVSEDLFEDLSFSFCGKDKKRIAIVGKNGCGKSSLLKIILGEIKPNAGKIKIYNDSVAYIAQEVDFGKASLIGEYLEGGLENIWEDYRIDIALEKVGLSQDYLIRDPETLSGGEKIKLALAYILLKDPSIILLDEPTNNLDQEGIMWLENFIRNFSGSIIVVSHDRKMINSAMKEIWELSNEEKGIIKYTGNYEDFLIQRKETFDRRMHDYLASKKKIDKLENWIKINQKIMPFSSMLAQRKRSLARIEKDAQEKPEADQKIKLGFLGKNEEGRMLIIDIKEKYFGNRKVLNNIYFKLYNEDRILLTGRNGSGKTTLLNIISGKDTDFIGKIDGLEKAKIAFMQQFSQLDRSKRLLQEFEDKTGFSGAVSRSVLANYLFGSDRIDDRVENLSYGELRRLDLAIILAKKPNVLILDEPTNHLDIFAREELESFILEQEIPMIIVSHDRYFVEKIGANKILKL